MVVVAVVAATLGSMRWWSLSTTYRSMARDFARKADGSRFDSTIYTPHEGQAPGDARIYSWYKSLELHYLTLMRKYERAARRPWFTVDPDPLAPQLKTFLLTP
jgi:hypothetical protein